MNHLDLNYIKTFLQVIESGSVAKAAEVLQYAQSTVSTQIQALETELGFSLFERVGRKNYLSNEGMEFLQYANDLRYTLQKISKIGQQPSETRFSLRIGVLESLLFDTLLRAIPVFKESYPNAFIMLKVGNAQELLEMLHQNSVDIIFISAAPNTDPSLSCLYTKKSDITFVSAPGHPLACRKNISLPEVLQYPFVLSAPTGQCYGIFHDLVAAEGLTANCTITVNENHAIAAFLQDNRSLSVIPMPAASYFLRSDTLTILDINIPPQSYYTQILVRKSTWISPAIQRLLSIIKELSPESERATGTITK